MMLGLATSTPKAQKPLYVQSDNDNNPLSLTYPVLYML